MRKRFVFGALIVLLAAGLALSGCSPKKDTDTSTSDSKNPPAEQTQSQTGWIVQAGDPQTIAATKAEVEAANGQGVYGTGGPGYTIIDEYQTNPNNKHVAGALAMARTNAPNSAGSQFYFCVDPVDFLDTGYTVFGQTTEGMDVLAKLEIGDTIKTVTIENIAPGQTPKKDSGTLDKTTGIYTPAYKPSGDEVAVFTTDKGTVKVKLAGKDAPVTVGNFIELANSKFYDGVKVHRKADLLDS